MKAVNNIVDTAIAVRNMTSTQNMTRMFEGVQNANNVERSIAAAKDTACNMNSLPTSVVLHGANKYMIGTDVVHIAVMTRTTRIHVRRSSMSSTILPIVWGGG